MEAFFHAYMAFTDRPDEILARRGLARVHHRILFFVAHYPGLSVKDLLKALGVTKQAINIPLRQLVQMGLVVADVASHDKRVKQLQLTPEGKKLEELLHKEQARLLERAFNEAEATAVNGWLQVNQLMSGCGPEAPPASDDASR
ncbi:MarR family winged helix-turn-helix transcriptional regulator [Paludibacterium yongneupense]|uniref:MarR family winged helix-turn-helix transcriptional regulator n=1 Tax=Paludibacterium yongneupense TaxID=400061 RepID=UPI000425871F|nr:MarR family transcriptional regulator [Paludibacterium yongneupense]